MNENGKTRRVDVIAYHDDAWMVAVNIRGVVSAPYPMTPKDGLMLGQYLQGELRIGILPSRARQVNRALQNLVAPDLLPEVGKQLVNMANMAEYWQAMAEFVDAANTPMPVETNQYLM